MQSADVQQAVDELQRVLTPVAARDWTVPAGRLKWSCWATTAHVAHDLLAYAGQVAAEPTEAYLPFDVVVRPDAQPIEVLGVVKACGQLLIRALAGAEVSMRAWHWGPTDPSGFAALGVNEALLHTYDITQGLGLDWRPPPRLCAAVLARLFPDAPEGDPVDTLLWSTGRAEFAGREPVTSWFVRAALSPGIREIGGTVADGTIPPIGA